MVSLWWRGCSRPVGDEKPGVIDAGHTGPVVHGAPRVLVLLHLPHHSHERVIIISSLQYFLHFCIRKFVLNHVYQFLRPIFDTVYSCAHMET